MLQFPKHEFECPICGLPLDENGWHENPIRAWDESECEYNTTHWPQKPVRVRPTQAMLNEPFFKRLVEQEAKLSLEIGKLNVTRNEVHQLIKERLDKG
jgi:hypothetical protein